MSVCIGKRGGTVRTPSLVASTAPNCRMGACRQPTPRHVADGDEGCMPGELMPIRRCRWSIAIAYAGTTPPCACMNHEQTRLGRAN